MKNLWTAFLAALLVTFAAGPALADTVAGDSAALSINGHGGVTAVNEDLLVKLEDRDHVTEVTIFGGAWLNPVKTRGNISVDYSQELTVRVDATPVVTIGKDNPAIRGIRVVRYSNNTVIRDAMHDVEDGGDASTAAGMSAETGTVTGTDADPDLVTCSSTGVVTDDDDCYVGGPGSTSATYSCGIWIFSTNVSVSCTDGYYACVTGCGYGHCRSNRCVPPPPRRRSE